MRPFHAEKQRIPKTEDSLAEGVEFELSVDFVNGQYVMQKLQEVLNRLAAPSLRKTWSSSL
jgi:hypothetical protein